MAYSNMPFDDCFVSVNKSKNPGRCNNIGLNYVECWYKQVEF